MDETIIIETRPMDTRAAVLEDGRLMELICQREGEGGMTGNIYLGRVETVLKGMQAAFVDIGLDKNAFLSLDDFTFSANDFGKDEEKLKRSLNASRKLRPGDEIPVQIVKVPGGDKGVRVSSHLSLPGRICVLLPTTEGIGVSRRIENAEERERLRLIAENVKPEGMGVIVRTAAENADEDDIRRELQSLSLEWASLQKRIQCVKAPRELKNDSDLVYRVVRDLLYENVDRVILEDEEAFERARNAAGTLAPDLLSRIELEKSDIPLFTRMNVKAQLEHALSRRVWLKSGGYLVIDRTEAMTVIDVNTGKFVGNTSLNDTIFRINLEAAEEIARQLRLRDIGGIVVIDFIDMDTDEKKQALVHTLRQCVKNDRTRVNAIGITELGLVELTRKRKRETLDSFMKSACPVCGGAGSVLVPEEIAFDFLGDAEHRLKRDPEITLLGAVSKRVFASLEKMNPRLSGVLYAMPDDKRKDSEYTLSPVAERPLPSQARQIGRN